jgi:hypothetical protein
MLQAGRANHTRSSETKFLGVGKQALEYDTGFHYCLFHLSQTIATMPSVQIKNELLDEALAFLAIRNGRLDVDVNCLSVREVIEASLRAHLQITRLSKSRTDTATHLLDADIASGLMRGKVALAPTDQAINADKELDRCLKAFSAGKFHIVVDGQWFRHLDDQVELHEDSKVLFLRLVPLVGG